MLRRVFLRLAALALAGGAVDSAVAHHSYAMFDGSRTVTVTGTLAKLG